MTNTSLDRAVLNHAVANIAKRAGRKSEAIAFVYEAAAYYISAGRDSFALRAVKEVAGYKEARAYKTQMQTGEHRVAAELMRDENI